MEDWQLPAELQQLERDLGNRSLPESSAACGNGCSTTCGPDCAPSAGVRVGSSPRPWLPRALLWMNLSMSATQATDFGLRLERAN